MKNIPIYNGKKKIKILFKVSGGPNLGLGHIRRSIELAQFLKEKKKIDIFFHCNKIDLNIIQNNQQIPFFFTPVDTDDRTFIAGLIRKHDIDVVIIDEANLDENVCKTIKTIRPGTRIVALDYFEYFDINLDIIINLQNQNLNISDPSQVFCGQYSEGIRYAIIRDSLVRAVLAKKNFPSSETKIVLTFGGSDVKGHTFEILRLLSKIDLEFSICVILGPMFKEPEKVFTIAECMDNCTLFINPTNYDDLIVNADLGFIGGGTTMLEFCFAGIPVIVVPQNVAELHFASFFERKKAVIILDDSYNEYHKIDVIKKMIQYKEFRTQMIAAQTLIIDTNGKDRISELILSGIDRYE